VISILSIASPQARDFRDTKERTVANTPIVIRRVNGLVPTISSGQVDTEDPQRSGLATPDRFLRSKSCSTSSLVEDIKTQAPGHSEQKVPAERIDELE
jgi:hypothetical protein